MAHGITLQMRAIKKPEPEFIHEHTTPTMAMRRQAPLALSNRSPKCEPYVNPARDLKRAISKKYWRLRQEAFTDALIAAVVANSKAVAA